MFPRFPVAVLLVCAHVCAESNGRVMLISLDGLGYHAFRNDPVAQELTSLRKLASEGTQARGMTPHFPSTTANSHAAIWTGRWGDRNGITSNSMPALPRSEHTFLERVNGYRSDGLKAEPLWAAAARQGIRTTAQQVTQAYPFIELNTEPNAVVVNGYQTKVLADHLVLRRSDMKSGECGPGACFTWTAGPVTFHGVLVRENGRYTKFVIRAGESSVEARLAPLETEPPRNRALARHFTAGLHLPEIPATVYFRLFDVKPDGSDFLLYQTPINEFGVHDGATAGGELRARMIREAGGFIGNDPGPNRLGTPLDQGGDGTAERRSLEIAELIASQYIAHARWLMRNVGPRLFISYLPYPDETEHNWRGLAESDARYNEFRAWGYAIANRFSEAIIAMRQPRDHIVFVSDHGMAPVHSDVHVNAAFRDAGLLAVNAKGAVDPARTKIMDIRNCLLVNTTDWKGGIVQPSEREAVMKQAIGVLREIRDPGTSQPVITRVYSSRKDAQRFGFAADACFDYAPGYGGSDGLSSGLVTKKKAPAGVHGFDPTRSDMEAIFIAAGPSIPKGATRPKIRAIDVAPFVERLLGISSNFE